MEKGQADLTLSDWHRAGFLAGPPSDELKAVAYILEDKWQYFQTLLGVVEDTPEEYHNVSVLSLGRAMKDVLKAQQDFQVALLVGFAEGVEHNIVRRLGGAEFHSVKDLLEPNKPQEEDRNHG